jgi:hypothetical protein
VLYFFDNCPNGVHEGCGRGIRLSSEVYPKEGLKLVAVMRAVERVTLTTIQKKKQSLRPENL